jgi:hypothetical protein
MTGVVKQIISLVALCTLSWAATIASGSGQLVPVSREQVAGAIQAAGFDASAIQLQLLSNVTSPAGTTLHVAKISRESAGTALAELHCPARQCLPFYVLVHDTRIAEGAAVPFRQQGVSRSAPARPLLERGRTITLMIERSDFRIVLPVISLESGMQGQIIRVTSPDHKRVYRAEIVNKTTVRSAL